MHYAGQAEPAGPARRRVRAFEALFGQISAVFVYFCKLKLWPGQAQNRGNPARSLVRGADLFGFRVVVLTAVGWQLRGRFRSRGCVSKPGRTLGCLASVS